jgi:acetyltransferase-like isoleucine patch superfamily enzyme
MGIAKFARSLVPPSLLTGVTGFWFRRIMGQATCVLGEGAKLGPTSRIQNARGITSAIRVGAHSIVRGELMIYGHGGEITLGEYCYVGEGTRLWSAASIRIGDRVQISHNVNIFDSRTHPVSAAVRHAHFVEIVTVGHPRAVDLGELPITIGPDVLIAAGVTILRGVTIGQGSMVGAGSVVTKDVPPFCVVAGNPARLIRELGEEER